MSTGGSSEADDAAADLLGRWQEHVKNPAASTPSPGSSSPADPAGDGPDDGSDGNPRDDPRRPADAAESGGGSATEGGDERDDERPAPPRRPAASGPHRTPVAPAAPRSGSNYVAAGREIVEALRTPPADQAALADAPAGDRDPASSSATPGTPPSGSAPAAVPPTPPAPGAPASASVPDPDPDTTPTGPLPPPGPNVDLEFPPRVAVRRTVGVLAMLSVLATAGAAYVAYTDPRPTTLGVAALLLVVSLVLYGVRASSLPTRLAIRAGQLEVTRGSSREVFDLTSRYTRVEVVGAPGHRRWKVLFGRFGRDPFVVDGAMVDPKRFMAALERYRDH